MFAVLNSMDILALLFTGLKVNLNVFSKSDSRIFHLIVRKILVRRNYYYYYMTKYLSFLPLVIITFCASSQQIIVTTKQKKELTTLIDNYSEARENKDTLLLKKILTQDIDQLVSTGEWRNGLEIAVKGMLRSSASTPGTRSLTVDNMKMLSSTSAIVDCRYEIQNADGSMRKMWSSFIAVLVKGEWRITSIRNMLPAGG